MKTFLQQVAEHYFSEEIGRVCFIFPNRRSGLFFKEQLKRLAVSRSKTFVAPEVTTINDFFQSLSGSHRADKIQLLLKLYDCYKALNPQAESKDDFIFWGDVLLSDFDDVDKYLVDPSGLFANISDYKNIQDNYSYLSDSQREALEHFLGHWTKGAPSDKGVKAEFRRLWDILLPLYQSFNERLRADGLSYEGQVYREIAERLDGESVVDMLKEKYPDCDRYVFVGLNALNECERKLLRKMNNAGIAEFCWDYCGEWIQNPGNRSSVFLSRFVQEFPQAFKLEDVHPERAEFKVISVPSSTAQAKILPQLLAEMESGAETGFKPGLETAIVLPDEGMLLGVLNSIPEDIRELNVTMGFPMNGSALWNLMNDLASLQLHTRQKDGVWYFYHKPLASILSSSIIKSVMDDESRKIVAAEKKKARHYVPAEAVRGTELLDAVFTIPEGEGCAAIADYQQAVLRMLSSRILAVSSANGDADRAGMAMELDFAREYWLAINMLKEAGLPDTPQAYFRLLDSLVRGRSVPFKGEPLRGLQIMGPLETRALDFDNVIILGCNEGVFPRHSVSSSFIPPELRRGFGLPTYEYQDSVWAYYFYRLICRAKTVTMLFDSRTEVSRSGEESRYIKQLEMDFGVKMERYVATAGIKPGIDEAAIEKTREHIDTLHSEHHNLSASALQQYLNCPAQFYYSYVLKLKPEDEVQESLDSGMLGSVFHETMEELYKDRKTITAEYVKDLLKRTSDLKEIVRRKIMEQLKTFDVQGRNIIFEDMVCKYVEKVLERDLLLMEKYKVKEFTIHGIEMFCEKEIGGFRFVGLIDRLDSFDPHEIRVVDYKTGKVTDEDFIITDENAEEVVEALFGDDSKKRPKIALQLYLYDLFVRDMLSGDSGIKSSDGSVIVNSIYQTSRLFVKDVESIGLSSKFCSLMKDRLEGLLSEIGNLDVPWERKTDSCEYCDFKNICGK